MSLSNLRYSCVNFSSKNCFSVLRNINSFYLNNVLKFSVLFLGKEKNKKGTIFETSLYARCHLRSYGKCYDTVKKKYQSKNTNCPAKIAIKKKRPLLDGMHTSTSICVDYNHNHLILGADLLRVQRKTTETEETVLKQFQNGHSPGTALQVHNFQHILVEHNYAVKKKPP